MRRMAGFAAALSFTVPSVTTVPLGSGRASAATVPTAPTAPASDTAPTAPASGPWLLRWGATMGGSQALTPAQAVTDAQSVNLLIGLSHTFGNYTSQMRLANPSLKLVYYLNALYGTNGTYDETWYLHDANGQRVISTNFNNPLMDPTNVGWIQSRVTECQNALASTGWDGCYLDMLGTGTLTPTYLTSVPLNPTTGVAWTDTDWLTATAHLAATVSAALPNAYVVGNGLGTGVQYFTSSRGPSSLLLGALVGADAQGFVRGDQDLPTQFRRETSWKMDVDMLIDAGHRGKTVLAESKVWLSGVTQDQKDAIHRYALATFLLGANGRQYWYWSDTGSESAIVEDLPYDHVNIGTPLGQYAKMLGVYQRRYTGGLVLVNPTPSAVTVPLPSGQWTTLNGTLMQGYMTLAANTGDVLSTLAPWGLAPSVETGLVSNITPTSATVSGGVNPRGSATTAWAELGPDSTLGTLSAPVPVGSGKNETPVQINLTGLTPGTTYSYHVDASSSAGTKAGADLTFSTPLPAPTVRTGNAGGAGALAASLTGYVNPNGLATTYRFEYGPDTSYGSSSAGLPAGSGTVFVTEHVLVSGLFVGVLHYRIVATNSTGTTYGSDATVRIL
jgi:hypothetical protein